LYNITPLQRNNSAMESNNVVETGPFPGNDCNLKLQKHSILRNQEQLLFPHSPGSAQA
jgi:hypothetical protein